MPEQLVYHRDILPSGTDPRDVLIGGVTGGIPGVIAGIFGGPKRDKNIMPDVYVDFETNTVRVVGSDPNAKRYNTGKLNYVTNFPLNMYDQQVLLQQALTSGHVPSGLLGDYGQLALELAGRGIDTRVVNAQFQNQPGGPLLTMPGQSEFGGGIPVASWISPAALAFQTPAARAIITGGMGRGPAARSARRKSAPRARVRRKRKARSAAPATTRRRRRGGAGKLVKGSPAAKRFMSRLRKMRGKRRSNG